MFAKMQPDTRARVQQQQAQGRPLLLLMLMLMLMLPLPVPWPMSLPMPLPMRTVLPLLRDIAVWYCCTCSYPHAYAAHAPTPTPTQHMLLLPRLLLILLLGVLLLLLAASVWRHCVCRARLCEHVSRQMAARRGLAGVMMRQMIGSGNIRCLHRSSSSTRSSIAVAVVLEAVS